MSSDYIGSFIYFNFASPILTEEFEGSTFCKSYLLSSLYSVKVRLLLMTEEVCPLLQE